MRFAIKSNDDVLSKIPCTITTGLYLERETLGLIPITEIENNSKMAAVDFVAIIINCIVNYETTLSVS